MKKSKNLKSNNFLLYSLIVLIFIAMIFFAFYENKKIGLSPLDSERKEFRGQITYETESEEFPTMKQGMGPEGIISLTQCDYMVEPEVPFGEEGWFEPYPVHHMVSPGQYIITSDLVISTSLSKKYPDYIKGCFTIVNEGNFSVNAQGHSISTDCICIDPSLEYTCTTDPEYSGSYLCPPQHSSNTAFFLGYPHKINLEVDRINIENNVSNFVEAKPTENFFSLEHYGLNDNFLKIINSNIKSANTTQTMFMGLNIFVNNSNITNINSNYCYSSDYSCEGDSQNPISKITFFDRVRLLNYFQSVQLPSGGGIYAKATESGKYDVTIQSISGDLEIQKIYVSIGNDNSFNPNYISHLSIKCKENCNNFIDYANEIPTGTRYYMPITLSLEMNEGEMWFGKDPNYPGVPIGASGDKITQVSGQDHFNHLSDKISISHNFASIKKNPFSPWFGEEDHFNRTALIVFHNNPSQGLEDLVILKDDLPCLETECIAYTALDAETVIFSVQQAGDYRIGGTPTQQISYSINLSETLSNGVSWNLVVPLDLDKPAQGNNQNGITDYSLLVSASPSTLVDVYIKADGNLISQQSSIPLANEKYSYSKTDSSVSVLEKHSLTQNYVKIGDALSNGEQIYLKFFLSVPEGQQPGIYQNEIEFIATLSGFSP